LEPTNEPYAIAKIAGVKMCESYSRQYTVDYRSVMPTNLYGPGDNYHPDNSHVIPALIRKFHEAKVEGKKSVVIWGNGKAKREFLYVDDLADACVFLMERCNAADLGEFVNIGFGQEITIRKLAELVAEVKALRLDGERYRWLRKNGGFFVPTLRRHLVNTDGDWDYDAAIDAAREGK
jgi:GDP-L-fucose synthase